MVTWSRNATKAAVSCLGQYEAATEVLELKSESITALAFAPLLIGGSYLVGVGLEIGDVSLYKWSVRGWTHLTTLDNGYVQKSFTDFFLYYFNFSAMPIT